MRELRATVEAAAALAAGDAVDAALLRFVSGEDDALPPPAAPSGSLHDAVAAMEAQMLRDALDAAGGNQSEAARTLGVSRVGLIRKMARLGLKQNTGT